MYPLKVILAGSDRRVIPQVREELTHHAIDVEAEHPDITDILSHGEAYGGDPRLFLVHLQNEEDFVQARRLSQTLVGRPILALIDEGYDSAVLIAAMRCGCAQVVPLPLDAGDFGEALDCIGVQFGRSPLDSRLVAVSGVTGGCGATTLAINLAHEFAQRHDRKTILTEVSLQIGMLVTYLDITPQYTLDDLLTYQPKIDVHLVDRTLTPFRDKLSVLAGPRRPAPPSDGAVARLKSVIDYLKHLADVVVLDVPCTFDDAYFEILSAVDQVVLVGEQRIPAVRNAQLVLDSLGRSDRGGKHHFVLNRYDPRLEGFTAKDLEKLLGLPRVATLTNDPVRVNAALNGGKPLREAAPTSPVLAEIERLAPSVLDLKDTPAPKAGGRNVFGRLFQAIGLK